MATDLARRSVVFNKLDPLQRRLYEHTQEYTNFSNYIKSLIQRDLELGVGAYVKKAPAEEVFEVTRELMQDFI